MSVEFIQQALFLFLHKKGEVRAAAVRMEAELKADTAYGRIDDMDFDIKSMVRKPCAARGTVETVNGERTGYELPDAKGEGVFFSVQCKGQGTAVIRKGQAQL